MVKERASYADKMARHMKHQKEKESKKSFGYLNLPKDIETFSMEDDVKEIRIDILPYIVSDPHHPDSAPEDDLEIAVGDIWWHSPFLVHRNVGDQNETVVCRKSIKERCPIDEYQKKRIKEGADKEEFKEYYPKQRSLYAIIPRAIKKKGAGKSWEVIDELSVKIWDMSYKLFEELLRETLEEDPSYNLFWHPSQGFSLELTIHWDMIGKNKFPTVTHIEFVDRDPYEDNVAEQVPDLDRMLKVLTFEEIESKFFDMTGDVSEGKLRKVEVEEEETNPDRRKSDDTTHKTIRTLGTKKETEDKPTSRIGEKKDGKTTISRTKLSPSPKETPTEEVAERHPSGKLRNISNEKTDGKERCLFGYQFGVDAMDYKECEEECEIWKECLKERQKRETV